MRKLFAGLAAAATLLGGLALGSVSAVADDTQTSGGVLVSDNATFTFTANDPDQWQNRKVKYYKLADYVKYDSDTTDQNKPVYGVQTASTANKSALTAALEAAVADSDPQLTVPDYRNTDLMAWALQQGALDSESQPWTGSTRLFADSLAKNTKVTKSKNFKTIDFGTQAGTDRTVQLPAGVYLFVDVTVSNGNPSSGTGNKANNGNISNGTEQNPTDPRNENGGKVVTQSAPIVLASGTVANNTISDPVNGSNTVAFKNHVTPVIKAYDDKDGTVSVGQTVNYMLKTTLPAFTTGFTDYTFTLTDTPGIGQDIDLTGLQVKVDGTLIGQGDGDNQYQLLFNDQVTADEQTQKKFKANGSKTFILDFSKYVRNHTFDGTTAKGLVDVKYQAVINNEATPSQSVVNSVEVNDNNSKAEDKTKLTTGEFSFVKTDAQGNPLKGATFMISGSDDNYDDDIVPIAPTDGNVQTSDENGKVTFTGLADGVYKVSETSAPQGFLSSARAEFKVTIKSGKAVYFDGTDFYGLAKDSGNSDLSGSEITKYSVINVRNVTQLPLTGAAGIMLFTVAGLLLAAAAGLVYTKSRATSRALRRH
ncbi:MULTISPECIES: SpaA isopeptide-forming pilin-related protein [Bifidobacterium]|uniref:SpaA isopeptide-forming pilin-related protein n=1 Tax=Bifidobacterium TaxID=1678 RepID=UPI001BDC63FB|nr:MULTISPECIES: SpaA isopeptide-forming pilin-related protein [Bifidobacterium]MBT1161944.1 isopeptide-forming domain-containing fimbrial protein [Bifidobacterium sp. SO1]MBW3079783.1 isopeptide-forming domain-containing fimbrial protein [Bifidobacterium simiiventris]